MSRRREYHREGAFADGFIPVIYLEGTFSA